MCALKLVADVTGNVKYIPKSVFWHQNVSPPAPPAPPPIRLKLGKCCENVYSSLKVIYPNNMPCFKGR